MAKIRKFLIRATFSFFSHIESNRLQIRLLQAASHFHSSQNPTVCPRNLQKPMPMRIFAVRKIEQTKNLNI
jgi:hypothetical protein